MAAVVLEGLVATAVMGTAVSPPVTAVELRASWLGLAVGRRSRLLAADIGQALQPSTSPPQCPDEPVRAAE